MEAEQLRALARAWLLAWLRLYNAAACALTRLCVSLLLSGDGIAKLRTRTGTCARQLRSQAYIGALGRF